MAGLFTVILFCVVLLRNIEYYLLKYCAQHLIICVFLLAQSERKSSVAL